jgi:two-component system cell cycle sensor histidine kinase/response regulator CckA
MTVPAALPGSPAHTREVVSEFAWGVAHDFSNFIQVILGFSELLRAEHAENEELSQTLGEIVVAAERAKQFISQLLILAQRREFSREPADLNALLHRLGPALHASLGPNVRLELQPSSGALTLPLDVPGVELILAHLCAQARDAMPKGGTVTVSTGTVRQPQGEMVRLSVCDTGSPVEPELAGRITEPYFMKRHGRGRGLEFAVMYELMSAYGGTVHMVTAPAGTAFHLDFPRAA